MKLYDAVTPSAAAIAAALSPAERAHLSRRSTGGEAFKNGHAYEFAYGLSKLLDLAHLAFRDRRVDGYGVYNQVYGFVDDLLVVKPRAMVYSQLKGGSSRHVKNEIAGLKVAFRRQAVLNRLPRYKSLSKRTELVVRHDVAVALLRRLPKLRSIRVTPFDFTAVPDGLMADPLVVAKLRAVCSLPCDDDMLESALMALANAWTAHGMHAELVEILRRARKYCRSIGWPVPAATKPKPDAMLILNRELSLSFWQGIVSFRGKAFGMEGDLDFAPGSKTWHVFERLVVTEDRRSRLDDLDILRLADRARKLTGRNNAGVF